MILSVKYIPGIYIIPAITHNIDIVIYPTYIQVFLE